MDVVTDRGIDHLVIAVRDLEKAAAAYRQLGFTTTPVAHHPWGTSNVLVQLDRFFLEIIAVTDETKLIPPTDRQFSFGSFLREFLDSDQGLAMLVFESFDASADCAEFQRKGISSFDRFDFERKAVLPDGSTAVVGFSLAFVAPPSMPKAVFFTCQQHAPQYFWKPAYQTHANGALGIGAVAMAAVNPQDLTPLMQALQGEDSVQQTDGGLHVGTARGWVDVLTPDACMAWYGDCFVDLQRDGPRFFATRIAVADLAATEALLQQNGVPCSWCKAGLLVSPEYLYGMAIAFVQAPETPVNP
ncbi:MAG: VOC family protein [Alphaproteobacteria bacterium]